jgi:hypothetical protein
MVSNVSESHLFQGDVLLSTVLETRQAQARAEIDRFSDENLLNVSVDTLVQHIESSYEIIGVSIREEEISIGTPKSVRVDGSGD